MINKRTIATFGLMLSTFFLIGQETWSLEKCIQYAKQNNIQVKTANYNLEESQLNRKEASLDRLPSANAGFGGGYQFGRTIDPTTNSYNNQRIGYNTYGLQTSVDVYNGNRLSNTLAKSKLDVKVAELEVASEVNNIVLQITEAYLNVLLAEEQLQNIKKRLQQSKDELQSVEQQIEAGTLRKNQLPGTQTITRTRCGSRDQNGTSAK